MSNVCRALGGFYFSKASGRCVEDFRGEAFVMGGWCEMHEDLII